MRRLAALATVLALGSCASLEDRFAAACRDLGARDGTTELASCLRDQRLAYDAHRAAPDRQVPPTFSGRQPGCYASRDTGVVC